MSNDTVYRAGVQWFGDTSQLDKSFKDVNKKLNSFSKGMKSLGKVIGLGFGAYSIKKLADMGKQMSNLAVQTGLSVTSLSAMSSAFKSIGSSAGTFSRIAGKMNQGIVGLAMGNPEVAAKLASMGISTVDESGKLKSSKQAMYEVADWAKAMKGMGFDSRMIVAALQEMGFDAASAQKAMYGGRGAFQAEEARARKEGRFMTDAEASNWKKLSTSIGAVNDQITYLLGAGLSPFAEVLAKLTDGFREGLAPAFKTIRKMIDENKDAFKQLGNAMSFVGNWLGKGLDFLLNFGNYMEQFFGWLIEKAQWLTEHGFGWLLGGVHEDVELRDEGFYRDENGKLQMTPARLEQMSNIGERIAKEQIKVENTINTTVNSDGTTETETITEVNGELMNNAQLSANNTK